MTRAPYFALSAAMAPKPFVRTVEPSYAHDICTCNNESRMCKQCRADFEAGR